MKFKEWCTHVIKKDWDWGFESDPKTVMQHFHIVSKIHNAIHIGKGVK